MIFSFSFFRSFFSLFYVYLYLLAGATVENDDLSLFYDDPKKLTKIPDRCRFLPTDLYGQMVRDCIIVCCDAVIVRYNLTLKRKECLIVKRTNEPAKNIWWWPGGRVLKGETFFAAAIRKAKLETGMDDVNVKPIQVLGIYNTFFPYSSWDTETEKGTQTVNAVVLVEVKTAFDVKLDAQASQYKWISLDPNEAIQNGEDPYIYKVLQRLEAWDPTYI